MKALSLFSGIGGLDLAAEAAGIEVKAMCEIEPFCVSILNKRWPHVPIIDDVRKVNKETFNETVDIVFGGFPCQDLSTARQDRVNRKGLEGARSGLWFEMERVVREIRPAWVLAENVRGAVDLALDTCTANLEAEGYSVRSFVIPASAFGATHRRDRLFIVGAREDVDNACRDRQNQGRAPRENETKGESPAQQWAKKYGLRSGVTGGWRGDPRESEGQLNPDWVEQLMGFPEGWTDPERETIEMWQGYPAIAQLKLWATPIASDCRGAKTNRGRSLRTDVYNIKHGIYTCPQHPYEFPRLAKGGKWRQHRIRALGNAVVPHQAYPLFQAIVDINSFLEGEDDSSSGCGNL